MRVSPLNLTTARGRGNGGSGTRPRLPGYLWTLPYRRRSDMLITTCLRRLVLVACCAMLAPAASLHAQSGQADDKASITVDAEKARTGAGLWTARTCAACHHRQGQHHGARPRRGARAPRTRLARPLAEGAGRDVAHGLDGKGDARRVQQLADAEPESDRRGNRGSPALHRAGICQGGQEVGPDAALRTPARRAAAAATPP